MKVPCSRARSPCVCVCARARARECVSVCMCVRACVRACVCGDLDVGGHVVAYGALNDLGDAEVGDDCSEREREREREKERKRERKREREREREREAHRGARRGRRGRAAGGRRQRAGRAPRPSRSAAAAPSPGPFPAPPGRRPAPPRPLLFALPIPLFSPSSPPQLRAARRRRGVPTLDRSCHSPPPQPPRPLSFPPALRSGASARAAGPG